MAKEKKLRSRKTMKKGRKMRRKTMKGGNCDGRRQQYGGNMFGLFGSSKPTNWQDYVIMKLKEKGLTKDAYSGDMISSAKFEAYSNEEEWDKKYPGWKDWKDTAQGGGKKKRKGKKSRKMTKKRSRKMKGGKRDCDCH